MPFFSQAIAASKSVLIPRISTTDLMWYYDPLNPNSYDGSSSVLSSLYTATSKDLSITGGPVYDSSGFFDYDGVNDQMKGFHTTTTNQEITVGIWVKADTLGTAQNCAFGGGIYSGAGMTLSLSFGNFSGVGVEMRMPIKHSGGVILTSNLRAQGANYASTGVWRFYVGRMWSNGDAQLTALNTSTNNLDYRPLETNYSADVNSTNKPVTLGSFAYNASYLNGKIAEVFAYDRAITNTEIQTIFDDTKSRYGY